jgi:hypothetical protein
MSKFVFGNRLFQNRITTNSETTLNMTKEQTITRTINNEPKNLN